MKRGFGSFEFYMKKLELEAENKLIENEQLEDKYREMEK